eukprot:1178166-Prorocentrum_minimum.AAC.4
MTYRSYLPESLTCKTCRPCNTLPRCRYDVGSPKFRPPRPSTQCPVPCGIAAGIEQLGRLVFGLLLVSGSSGQIIGVELRESNGDLKTK